MAKNGIDLKNCSEILLVHIYFGLDDMFVGNFVEINRVGFLPSLHTDIYVVKTLFEVEKPQNRYSQQNLKLYFRKITIIYL